MKKLILLLVICLGVTSCKTKETFQNEKPLYYKQYQKDSITKSEYIFLCKGEDELFNIKYKVK